MSFETRNNSAMSKRAEQLKRWEESDTNREPDTPKNAVERKIKFSSGCVFLAACMSGDKDEVLRLLDQGADIDTANVDGLTALHQACIDDNLEMVEFLVNSGADVNRQDNEGWTPLHATSSCGFVSIARYLIESAANLAAVSSDGELAIDLAESDRMEALLQKHIDEQGIDCVEARQSEERLMLNDAKNWLRSDASEADKPHPRTGATALHVAAAKGYCKVLSLLLATRADVDKQDNDGWAPLHAAAHWGQNEAAQMLVAAQADMDIKNYAGQTALDVADPGVVRFLEDLKKNNKRSKRRPSSHNRISDNMDNHIETPSKVIRVDVKATADHKDVDDDKPKPPSEPAAPISKDIITVPEEDTPWRRSGSLRTRLQQESPPKNQVPAPLTDKESTPATQQPSTESEVILRRTQSFENDEKFYQKYQELRARIKANSCPVLPATPGSVNNTTNTTNNYSVQRSASLKDHRQLRKTVLSPIVGSPTSTPSSTNTANVTTSPQPGGQVRRSFVPPVRDEESETQRKAHAKRVRETRRSTQGVTLDEIKSAEELVKKKNMNNNNGNSDTTAATTASTINDRVPSIKSADDDDMPPPSTSSLDKSNLSSISTTTTNTSSSSTPSQISASYTISVPPIPAARSTAPSPIVLATNDDDNKITATYTIPSPTGNQQLPSPSSSANVSVTVPAANTHTSPISPTKYNSNESKDNSESSISATINVPSSNNNKTDLESLTKTATPTIAQTNFKYDRNHQPEKSGLDGQQTDDGQTDNFESKRSSSSTPTVDFTFNKIGKDKRSLFDIDNASSLSLADKLRNEANKYSSETASQPNLTDNVAAATVVSTAGIVSSGLSKLQMNAAAAVADGEVDRKTDSTPSSPLHHGAAERRPSWRLKFDAGCKFKLEDAAPITVTATVPSTNSNDTAAVTGSAPATPQRRVNSFSSQTIADRTSDTVKEPVSNYKDINTEVTLSLGRPRSSGEDKENDSRSAQSTQAVIQRRRRPKRRSTGVVHVDMDDIDPDRQESNDGTDDKESGSERTSRSRLGSTSSLVSDPNEKSDSTENGDHIDYKALYEAARNDNEKLKMQLKKKEEDLFAAKATVDRFANATTKNSLSELEKRERRAMERKLSEMEEELKQLQKYKTENERLRAENRALTRVVSKLTTSAQNQLHSKQ